MSLRRLKPHRRNLALVIGISVLVGVVTHFSASASDNKSKRFRLYLPEDDKYAIGRNTAEALERFLALAESKLPESVKTQLNFPIPVRFKKLDNTQKLLAPQCTADPHAPPSEEVSQILGRRTYASIPLLSDHVIELHQHFIGTVLQGEARAEAFPCRHRNFYRTALASLLHEVMHVYDRELKESHQERVRSRYCSDRNNLAFPGLQSCKEEDWQISDSVSSDPQFMALSDWTSGIFTTSQGNHYIEKSPDVYEYSKPSETFAVNMEYFLLDPEFACRRPGLHEFLSHQFLGYDPAPGRECRPHFEVELTSQSNKRVMSPITVLDPNRIYQVHYLMAGEGEGIASGWGHSMFRLIVCHPDRPQVGPDCMQDRAFHIVAGFAGNVQDGSIDVLKGLLGGYDSLIFFSPYIETYQQYAKAEFRELISLPIKFSAYEKKLFITAIAESFWTYQGSYRFLTNNCADEALKIIKRVVRHESLLEEDVCTPGGIIDELIDAELVDEALVNDRDRAKKEGNYIPSQEQVVREAFEEIQRFCPDVTSVGRIEDHKGWIEKTKSRQRIAVYQKALARISRLEHQAKLVADFLLLEEYAETRHQGETRAREGYAFASYLNWVAERKGQPAEKIKNEWMSVLGTSHFERSKASYGLPSVTELTPYEEAEKRHALAVATWMSENQEFVTRVQQAARRLVDESKAIQGNKSRFTTDLLEIALKLED